MNKSLHIILFLFLALSGHADITHAYDSMDRLVRYSAGTAYVRQSGSRQHERTALRSADGTFSQSRQPRASSRPRTELQQVLLLPQQSA